MNKLRKQLLLCAVALRRALMVYQWSQWLALLLGALLFAASDAMAQTTAFTYQGKLTDSGTPATGTYDMQFKLFDNPNAGQGTQQGATITNPTVQVSGGFFTVQLDFGAAVFAGGASRYLEVSLRPAGNTGGYTQLAPRQQVTTTPYAVQSLNATTAVNATNATNATTAQNAAQLGGIAASQYVLTNDSRMTDARNPLPNSPNYVQNTTVPQASTNFNIAGNGLIGGSLGLGTSGPSTKLQVHTTGLDQHLYLSSAAPSLVLGNHEVRSSATMNGLFALATAASHFGVEAGGLMIATYGNERGNIYIDSNYSGNGVKNVILQPFVGSVGIGISTPSAGAKLQVDGGLGVGIYGSSTSDDAVVGESTDNVGVFGKSINGIGVLGYSVNGGVAGQFSGKVVVTDILSLLTLGSAGSAHLCLNGSFAVASCSSSLRYKTAIQPFSRGFDLIKQLRPITFTWKQDGMRDVGFGAEDVEKIEPLLVTYNPKGEVEGVKYDRITVALVNAVREQQTQIEWQRKQINEQHTLIETEQAQIKEQRQQVAALKKLVCADHPDAEVCQSN